MAEEELKGNGEDDALQEVWDERSLLNEEVDSVLPELDRWNDMVKDLLPEMDSPGREEGILIPKGHLVDTGFKIGDLFSLGFKDNFIILARHRK